MRFGTSHCCTIGRRHPKRRVLPTSGRPVPALPARNPPPSRQNFGFVVGGGPEGQGQLMLSLVGLGQLPQDGPAHAEGWHAVPNPEVLHFFSESGISSLFQGLKEVLEDH